MGHALASCLRLSRIDPVIPIIECSQSHVVEVDAPDPVVGLLEADGLLSERVAQEVLADVEPERSRVRGEAHEVVAGMFPGAGSSSGAAVATAAAPSPRHVWSPA